jgi:hypothetical protein
VEIILGIRFAYGLDYPFAMQDADVVAWFWVWSRRRHRGNEIEERVEARSAAAIMLAMVDFNGGNTKLPPSFSLSMAAHYDYDATKC